MVFKEVESDRFWWREGQCQGGEKWFNGSRADRGLAPRTLSHSMFQGSWRSEPLLKKMVEKARKFLLSSCEYDVSRLYPVLSSIFCWTLWHNFPVRVLERIHEKVQIHVLQYKIGRPCHTSNKYLNCVILHLCYFTSLCYFTLSGHWFSCERRILCDWSPQIWKDLKIRWNLRSIPCMIWSWIIKSSSMFKKPIAQWAKEW